MADKKFSDEIEAMGSIEEALTPLDEETRGRVIRWAAERYGAAVTAKPGKSGKSSAEQPTGVDSSEYQDLPSMFAAAAPSTDADKALVVGYWFQYRTGEADFDA